MNVKRWLMDLNRIKLVVTVLILLISVAGCIKKDELTTPARVHLKIAFDPLNESSEDKYFYFNWSHIGIQRVEFVGKREAGEDIFFETDPEMNLPIVKFDKQPESISIFEIPQGIYNHMTWDIYMKKTETSGLFDLDIPDAGLIISVIYEYPDGSDISVYLCIDVKELFSFKSYDPDFEGIMVLSETKVNEVVLFLDPSSAFSPVSRESIEKAEISNDIYGQPIIIISSNKNKDLYQYLVYRISRSASAFVY